MKKTNDTTPDSPFTEFQNYLKKKNQSENTIIAYMTSIRHFYSLYQELTVANLKAYREYLIENYQPATTNQRIHATNIYLQFLETKHPEQYPEFRNYRLNSVKLPRSSFKDTIISNDDCRLLEEKLKEEHQDFWYFVVRFFVTTGARVSELTQIKVEHLTCGYLDLYSKGGKTRRIYITDTLCKEASEWCRERGQRSGFLFINKNGQPVTSRGIHSQLKYFANRYGIDPDSVYPHSFRHRLAKNFLARNGDIALLADLMGHESIETTRIYLVKSKKEQQEILEEIVTW